QLRISAPLYQPVRLQGLAVKANQVSKQNVSLAAAEANVQVVEVVAQANRAAEATQLVERKKSTVISETVSAEAIKKTPDKDAAAAVKRLPAVTIKDDKYAFVRGLGPRYVLTTLDGSRLPSTDPDKRSISLDLFPADFIQSLSVAKTTEASLPGDFSGALVDIRLTEFPDQFNLSAGGSVGANTQTTFQQFLTYQGCSLDPIGQGFCRNLPGRIPETAVFKSLSEATRDELGQGFRNVWSPETDEAPMNGTGAISIGDTIGKFGYSLAGMYRA